MDAVTENPLSAAPLTEEDIARYVVAVAVWAPSVHNTQPWRFTVGGQQISLHADTSRQLTVADPEGREMMISCGAALFTTRLALRSLSYMPQSWVLPDPVQPLLVARVSRGRDFAHGSGWGLPPPSTASRFRSAGVVGVLTTAHDRPVDWVGAGQALQRILLTAGSYGVAAALHSQPLELGWLRESIRTQLTDGAYPHLILRFGAVIQATVSVRRPPEDVLLATGAEHLDSGDG